MNPSDAVDPHETERKPSEQQGLLLNELKGFDSFSARYTVEGEIARGGMGVVFRVWDKKLRRSMAMKVLRDRDDAACAAEEVAERSPRLLARFLEEAQIMGQIDHPGVVPVHDMGIDDAGRVFFTMKLVRGQDFKQVLELVAEERDGWTVTRAVGVILRVCEAMALAHAKGALHRDLKPANIMVGRLGEAYVMDWGLAKVLGRTAESLALAADGQSLVRTTRRSDKGSGSGSALSTLDGDVVGTPSYMSPEQALGLLEEVGPRSDVYSAGCLLYHLLTGRPPYVPPDGKISAATVLRLLIEGPPAPVEQLALRAPAELAAICAKAMSREPHQRYETMEAMAEDLRAYLENRVVRAHRRGAVAEFRKWVGRNRGAAGGLAASLLLLIAGLSSVAFVQSRARANEVVAKREIAARAEEALANERLAREETSRADALAREAERQSYVANLRAASASLRTQEILEARRRLDACPVSLRGFEWMHLNAQIDESLLALRGHSRRVNAVRFAPAPSPLLASCSDDGAICLWDRRTGEQRSMLRQRGARVLCIDFDRSGAHLAAGYDDGAVRVYDVESEGVQSVFGGHGGAVTRLDYDETGAQLATGDAAGNIVVHDGVSGAERARFEGKGEVLALAFDRGDRLFALRKTDDEVPRVLQWRTTDWSDRSFNAGFQTLTALEIAGEGKLILLGSEQGGLSSWKTAAKRVEESFVGHRSKVHALAASPDGETFVSASEDRTVRIWETSSGAGLGLLGVLEEMVVALTYSNDGLLIATGSGDGCVRLWDATTGGADRELIRLRTGVLCIRSSSDGSLLALGTEHGAVGVVDVNTWHVLWRSLDFTLSRNSRVHAVAFSRDGSRIFAGGEDGSVRVFNSRTGHTLEVLRASAPMEEEPGERETAEKEPDKAYSVQSLDLHPASSLVLTGCSDESVRMWDVETGECLYAVNDLASPVRAVAFTPDGGAFYVALQQRDILRMESQSGRLLDRLVSSQGSGGLVCLAQSSDGRTLATGHDGIHFQGLVPTPLQPVIELFDAAEGASRAILEGHSGAVLSLAFSSDGSRVASGSHDQTVRLWDVSSGDLLLSLHGHEDAVRAVDFDRPGARLYSAAQDGLVRVWDSRLAAERRKQGTQQVVARPALESFGFDVSLGRFLRNISGKRATEEADLQRLVSYRFPAPLSPTLIAQACWPRVLFPGDPEVIYRQAVVGARFAMGRQPDEPRHRTLLAAARYRCGEYEEALALLGQDPLTLPADCADLAFTALSAHALGRNDLAQSARERLTVQLQTLDPEQKLAVSPLAREVEETLGP